MTRHVFHTNCFAISIFLFSQLMVAFGASSNSVQNDKISHALATLRSDGVTLQRLEAIGGLYQSAGDFPNAAMYFHMAIELDEANDSTVVKLVRLYLAAGKANLAVKLLEGGIEKFPESAELLIELGGAYTAFEKYQQAIEVLEKALRLEENNPLVQFHLAEAFFLDERVVRARALLEDLLEAGDKSLNTALLYGRCLFQTEGERQAVRQLERLLAENPENGSVRDTLVEILVKFAHKEQSAGRLGRAIKLLEQAETE